MKFIIVVEADITDDEKAQLIVPKIVIERFDGTPIEIKNIKVSVEY